MLLFLLSGCPAMNDLPSANVLFLNPTALAPMTVEIDNASGHRADQKTAVLPPAMGSGLLSPIPFGMFVPSFAVRLSQREDGSVVLQSGDRR